MPVSKSEKVFARALNRRGLWFKQQITLRAKNGTTIRNVDFVLRSRSGKKIVVEIDGDDHNEIRDKKISKQLSDAGYIVRRFSNDDAANSSTKIVSRLVEQFKPLRTTEVAREVSTELRECRRLMAGVKMKSLPGQKGLVTQ